MTLELDGVNGYSRLARNKEWLVEQAKRAPAGALSAADHGELPAPGSRHGAPLHRRSCRALAYPFYRTHRPGSALMEASAGAGNISISGLRERQAERGDRWP